MKTFNMATFRKWKENKTIQEFIISSHGDGIDGKFLVICDKLEESIVELKHRRESLGYIIQSLGQLRSDRAVIETVAKSYGLNFIFDMNKNQIGTFNFKSEKVISNEEMEQWNSINNVFSEYENLKAEYNKILIDEFGTITKENIDQLKQISNERGYTDHIKNVYNEYRRMFEQFIKDNGYNPFNYYLVNNR